MGQTPYWDDAKSPDLWDGLVLAGPNGTKMFSGNPSLEGVATVNVSFGTDIDVKKPHGADGATLTVRGQMIAEVDISIAMISQAHWDNFTTNVAPQLRPPAGRVPASKGLDIFHPATRCWGITSIVVQKVDGPKVGKDGIAVVTLKCLEYRPAAKGNAVSTAAGTIQPAGNALTSPAPGKRPTPPSATIPRP